MYVTYTEKIKKIKLSGARFFFNRIQNMNVEIISFRIKVGSLFLSAT